MELFKNTNVVEFAGRDRELSGKMLSVLIIKYLYPGISLVMLAFLIALAVFLYFNAYLSVGHAQNVSRLKQQILEEDLRGDDLTRVAQALGDKTVGTPINLEATKNPFEQKWEIKN